MSTTQGESTFRVGDRVAIRLGRRTLTGVIVEDRGGIGVRGRRLFRVDIPMDPFEPMEVELPEDEMEPVAEGAEATGSIDRDRIAEYLVNGGLISILRSNLLGGKNQPRVWLSLDNLGNVTHTLAPERGIIGGQMVPFGAVHDDKVFTPRRDAVLSFIEGFGLTQRQAEQIVAEVGAAP